MVGLFTAAQGVQGVVATPAGMLPAILAGRDQDVPMEIVQLREGITLHLRHPLRMKTPK